MLNLASTQRSSDVELLDSGIPNFCGFCFISLLISYLKELLYNLHFWIGKYSTADEYGTAAYKTVELDTLVSRTSIVQVI